MGAGTGIRRLWKAGLVVLVAAAGVGAAVAVASVPDSNGVIHACYPITVNGQNQTVPVVSVQGTPPPYLRVIDPGAGQTCNTVNASGGPPPEATLSWKQTGPRGAQGATGAQGPQGRSITIAGGNVITIAGTPITVGSAGGVTIRTPSFGAHAKPIGTATLDGPTPITFAIYGLNLAGTHSSGGGGGAGKTAGQIIVVKLQDRSSPKLSKACATGDHFPKAVLTVRKQGATNTASDPIYVLSGPVTVSSYSISSGGDRPTESLSLSFTHLKVSNG